MSHVDVIIYIAFCRCFFLMTLDICGVILLHRVFKPISKTSIILFFVQTGQTSTCLNVLNAATYSKIQTSRYIKCTDLIPARNQCLSTGRCSDHSKPLQCRLRARYIGFFIPFELSRPIRAGLLLGVDRGALFDLIVQLMQNNPISYPA